MRKEKKRWKTSLNRSEYFDYLEADHVRRRVIDDDDEFSEE